MSNLTVSSFGEDSEVQAFIDAEGAREIVNRGEQALVHAYYPDEKLLRYVVILGSEKIWAFKIEHVEPDLYQNLVRELTTILYFNQDTVLEVCERVIAGQLTSTQ